MALTQESACCGPERADGQNTLGSQRDCKMRDSQGGGGEAARGEEAGKRGGAGGEGAGRREGKQAGGRAHSGRKPSHLLS